MTAPATRATRFRRGIIFALSGMAVAALAGVITVLIPSIQRSIFLSLLVSPGLDRVEVGQVRFRPGSFLVENLVIEEAGMRTEVGRAWGEGGIWKALLGRAVELRVYEVEGWSVRLDRESLVTAGKGGLPVESALALLPLFLTVDEFRVNGQLAIETGPEGLIHLEMEGEGTGLGPDRVGRIGVAGTVQGLGLPDQPLQLDFTIARGAESDPVEIGVEGTLGEGADGVFLTLVARQEDTLLTVEGAIEADLPPLDALLGWGDPPRLASGRGRLSFATRANHSGEMMVDGELAVSGLELTGGYHLDQLRAPYRLILIPDTSFSLRAPIVIDRGGLLSDLQVAVSAVADDPDWQVDGTLSGDQIKLEDLAILAPLFRIPTDPEAIDASVAWRSFRGHLGLDLARVWVGSGAVLEDLAAGMDFSDDEVRIEEATAVLAGGALMGRLSLGFDASAPLPYRLESRWTASGVEIDKLLDDRAGGAVMDGPFALDLTTEAAGGNLRALGGGLTGRLALLGGPGSFRGFQEQTRSASNLAGMLGALLGSDRLQALAGLGRELGEIHYEQIRMNLERDETGRLAVERLQLQGPDIKLAGEGWIESSGWADYADAPMALTFRMGAKGTLADLLGMVGLTELGRIDAEGYRLMTGSFKVRGSPARPDVSELWGILRQAATDTFFGGGR
ncbi:MAG: hypothetical protein R3F07_17410 [Opitutaceae bacterium]